MPSQPQNWRRSRVHGLDGWQVHGVPQPSPPWQVWPVEHCASDVQVAATGAAAGAPQEPRLANGRAGQVPLDLKVTPSQPQNSRRSAVHGLLGWQVQGAAQPSPPAHIRPCGQSVVVRQVAGAAGGGATVCASQAPRRA